MFTFFTVDATSSPDVSWSAFDLSLEGCLKERRKMGRGGIAKKDLKTSIHPEERIIFIFFRIKLEEKSAEGEFKEDSKEET